MKKLLSIEQAADLMGVSTSTMRRWEKAGKLIPDERTAGNQRRYLLSSIKPQMKHDAVVERRTKILSATISRTENLVVNSYFCATKACKSIYSSVA